MIRKSFVRVCFSRTHDNDFRRLDLYALRRLSVVFFLALTSPEMRLSTVADKVFHFFTNLLAVSDRYTYVAKVKHNIEKKCILAYM